MPSSTVLTSTKIFAPGSFVAKNRSTEVKKIPSGSVTVKDCASGSLCTALVNFLTLTSVFLFLGLGGFLTETRFVSCVRIVPAPLYVPIASEANTVDPGSGVTPGGTAVTLTVLVPLLTLTAGAGLEFGFLKLLEHIVVRDQFLSLIHI